MTAIKLKHDTSHFSPSHFIENVVMEPLGRFCVLELDSTKNKFDLLSLDTFSVTEQGKIFLNILDSCP